MKRAELGGNLSSDSASFWFNLLFDPEDGGNIFLPNADLLSPDYRALYSGKQTSS
jgi:hypothetical protein